MPITFGKTLCMAAAVALAPLAALAQPAMDQSELAGPPSGAGSYQDLVSLYDEFLSWKDDAPIVGEISDSAPWSGVADYSDEAVAERRAQLNAFMDRMMDMNVAAWDQSQQADYLAVRAKLDEHNLLLNVSKPWARDPGFYGDQMQAVLPSYLEMSMESFARQQEQMQEHMGGNMGSANAYRMFEEMTRQNMAMFQNALRMFNPSADAGAEPSAPAGGGKRDEDLSSIRDEMEALRKRLDEMSKG